MNFIELLLMRQRIADIVEVLMYILAMACMVKYLLS
jgi:hypothetical protein